MDAILIELLSHIPEGVDLASLLPTLVLFGAGTLILGVLGRIFLGKRSSLNHSVSSAMAILFIYGVTIVVYTFKPWNLTEYLSPLPFVRFAGEHLFFFSFDGVTLSALSTEILSLLILAFLVNLLDTFLPQGESIPSWFLFRFLTVVLSMGLHLVVNWAFNAYLPDFLVTYAPMILLGVLAAMLLVGILNLLLSVVLTVVNPIIGAIYAFFFSNVVGKQLTKAVFTTGLLCVLFFLLNYFGLYAVSIAQDTLLQELPYVGVVLLLWFILGHTL